MKKFLSIVLGLVFTVSIFAQSKEAADLKNAGNTAYKAKNYQEALAKWEEYLKVVPAEELEASYFQNCGMCCLKMKNYDGAVGYYDKAIGKNYKEDASMYYKAYAFNKKGDSESYEATLRAALEKFPTSRYAAKMKKMLAIKLNKEASIPFNKGEQLAGQASGKAGADYVAQMNKAIVEYNVAKELFGKTLEVDANNALAKAKVSSIDQTIQTVEDYKKTLK